MLRVLILSEQFSTEKQFRVAPARLAELTRQSTLDMCIAVNPAQANGIAPILLTDTKVGATTWEGVDFWSSCSISRAMVGCV